MKSISNWLEPFTWEFVTAQNQILCQQKAAHHGPNSDGYLLVKELWEEARLREMSLFDVIDICRRCHRLAPFTNYNGNTFAAIARIIIRKLNLEPEKEHLVRSLAGHIVAGVASDKEIQAFQKFCNRLG